jgi:S1-C subfamily serine protease
MRYLISIVLFLPTLLFSQNLNGFKYVHIPDLVYQGGGVDIYGLTKELKDKFENVGFEVINDEFNTWPKEAKSNRCLILEINHSHSRRSINERYSYTIDLIDCNKNKFASIEKRAFNDLRSTQQNLLKAQDKAFRDCGASYYSFDSNETPILSIDENFKKSDETELTLMTYYESNELEAIEGIYQSVAEAGMIYKVGVKKDSDKFLGVIIESSYDQWNEGDIKFILNATATDGLYTCKYFTVLKKELDIIVFDDTPGLLKFNLDSESTANFIKLYPSVNKSKSPKNGEWAGNGSGIIISNSGHIITNHHVIDDADDIEVEFILNNEVQKFNAEIIQSDKINDLAIIKIVDVNFDGVEELPYNFKTRSSDVGTKVYAFGYPMALSIMGKEIKVTDGIISSKTGFDGNITTYQITAPIQGGNSGGPLFDDKGNLIGINSSGIRKDIADNVGYSIKTNYVLNLIDILPKSIDLPSSTKLSSLTLTEQIKEISKYVVLIKVK